jgi:hypothetical protein
MNNVILILHRIVKLIVVVDFFIGTQQENETPICKECSKKDMENATLKKTIMKMHEDDKSTKNNMKLLIVICLLLTVICVIFVCRLVLM